MRRAFTFQSGQMVRILTGADKDVVREIEDRGYFTDEHGNMRPIYKVFHEWYPDEALELVEGQDHTQI